jgi:hypothetical protein
MDLMHRTSRWLKIGFYSLVVGTLLGVGVAAFLYFQRGPAHHLQTGESSYQKGLQAVQSNQLDQAMIRFQEALLSCENALKDLEGAQESPPGQELDKQQRLMGHSFWLKYRALKARGFTHLLIEGKPLPTFEGQAEGTSDVVISKLSVLRLSDEQVLREAITCLREAAYRLPGSAEVLREAVATEVQIEPLQWDHIQAFATTLEKLDANDERGQYLLARLEYEQPIVATTTNGSTVMPLPLAKRSRDRMIKGIDHVAHLKELEHPIRWRTLYLEAQLHAWLVQYYHQPAQRKVDAERKELQVLRMILLDGESSVLARAARDERLGKVSRLDLQGLYGLHQMALELVLEDSRQPQSKNQAAKESDQPRLGRLQRVMGACIFLAQKTQGEGRVGQATDFLAQALLKAMPMLVHSCPDVWDGYLHQTLALAQKAEADKVLEPMGCLRLADLLTKESQWHQSQKNSGAAEKERQDAEHWLDCGLEQANRRRLPPDLLLALHEAKLRLLVDRDGGPELLRPHLDVLRSSKSDSYVAVCAYYEGLSAEREGKLEISRRLLEQALLSGRSDLTRRTLSRLVPLYLGLGVPEKSLAALAELERRSARFDALNDEEKQWYYTFLQNPDTLTAFKVQAHVEAARQKKDQRDQALMPFHEEQAGQFLAQLTRKTTTAARARICWTQYLLERTRLEEADQQLAILKRDHPDLIAVMQLQLDRLMAGAKEPLPPESIVQGDNIIQNYLRLPNASPAARLAWLGWLTNTGRSTEAHNVLADPAFFADVATKPEVQRIKVIAQLYYGKKPQTPILASFPHDPEVDIALLQAAASATEQQQILKEALSQHRDVGLFKAWSAALALAQGDHAQAFQGFLGCLEYTRAKPLARQGVTQALLAMAQTNPQEARTLATMALQKNPSEISLLLGYAHASLILGEVGNPLDMTEQVKDMATALRAYEAAARLENLDPAQGPWVAAQYWLAAGRPDQARQEIARILEQNPKHEAALAMGLKLALESDEPYALGAAQKMVALYQQIKPQAPEGPYWRGQLLQRSGKKSEALACYRDLLAKHPKYNPAYATAIDMVMTSSSAEARGLCEELLQNWKQANPDDLLMCQAAIRYQAAQGKMAEARQIFEQRLNALKDSKTKSENSIQPVGFSSEQNNQSKSAQAFTTDLLVQGLMKANQYGEAEKWLQRALEAAPAHEPTLVLLGEVLIQRMQQLAEGSAERKELAQRAADCYHHVYAHKKGDPLVGNNLAWLQVAELADAAEAYRIAGEVRLGKFATKPMSGDRLSPDFLDTLGLIYEKLGSGEQTPERMALFESAAKRYTQDARVFLHLGHAYTAAKETKKAQQAYETARSLLESSQTLALPRKKNLEMEIERGQARLRQLAGKTTPN